MQNTGNTMNGSSQENSNLSTLAQRIKAKTEQGRQEIEALTQQQFSVLQRNLSESSKNALSTTEAAILAQLGNLESSISSRSRTLHRAFGWTCLRGLLLSLSILTGAGLGSWGLLTPEGWTIINSGMAGKRDAWRIVRK